MIADGHADIIQHILGLFLIFPIDHDFHLKVNLAFGPGIHVNRSELVIDNDPGVGFYIKTFHYFLFKLVTNRGVISQ